MKLAQGLFRALKVDPRDVPTVPLLSCMRSPGLYSDAPRPVLPLPEWLCISCPGDVLDAPPPVVVCAIANAVAPTKNAVATKIFFIITTLHPMVRHDNGLCWLMFQANGQGRIDPTAKEP
jgi:hypothetical protein